MLIEIQCDKFMSDGKPREPIRFQSGLNVVLGTENAYNSIGKSTFLMIIDFVFGGNDYVNESTDVQEKVHGHTIKFAFEFEGVKHHYSRETTDHTVVWRCNSTYEKLEEMRLQDFNQQLMELYRIDLYKTTFRDIVGRYFRVYGRDNLDEKEPLLADKKAGQLKAIESLMKLFDKYRAVEELALAVKNKKDEQSAYTNAQKHKLIPKITKTDYKKNVKRLSELACELETLHEGMEKGLLGLDSKDAEVVADFKQKLSNAKRNKTRLLSQLKSIENDMGFSGQKNWNDDGQIALTLPDFSKLERFFPNVDIKKMREIQQFHVEMTSVLLSEFEAAKKNITALITLASQEVLELEQKIIDSGVPSKITTKMLNSFAEKKNETDKLERENQAHVALDLLKTDTKELTAKLAHMQSEQFITVSAEINKKMNELNDYIYDGEKKAPILNIASASKYTFFTPDDSGTGSSYKGLIVFDLSILDLTQLPAIIHDSVTLKQIGDDPLEKIMQLYCKSEKQIFVAIDKKGGYSPDTQKIIDDKTVLYLSPNGNELFGYSWNKKQANISDETSKDIDGGNSDE